MKRLKFLEIPLAILYYTGIAFLIETLISRKDAFLILCYHKIGHIKDIPPGYSISKELFEDQIKFINKNCNIVQFSDIDRVRKSRKQNVIITFDDGWKNNYTNAFSLIKKYNIPVYIFLVSDFINSRYFLNWDQIFEMKKSGLIIFGNHTKNHLSLKTLGCDEIKSQILDANKELKKKLDNVEYFSYPNGHFDNRVVKIVKDAGFKYGFTIIEGINDRDSNPFLLKRISIYDLNIQTRFLLKYPNLTYKIRSWYQKK